VDHATVDEQLAVVHIHAVEDYFGLGALGRVDKEQFVEHFLIEDVLVEGV
jgi:hypothetical protein